MGMNLKVLKKFIRATFRDARYNWNHLKHQKDDLDEIKFSELRKYCHMLDKALNNPNFEKGHSSKIYVNARKSIIELEKTYGSDLAFAWCKKITEQFESAQLLGKPAKPQKAVVSYTADQKNFIETFLTSRVSVRNFTQRKISLDVLTEIVRIAADAPNGCCRQSTRFYIVQNKKKIEQLAPHVAGLTNFTNIACLVGVAGEGNFYELVDKNLLYIDAALAAENFILAASIYGIYGTMCNFFHASSSDISEVKKIMEMKPSENIALFIAIGIPATLPEKPQRRETNVYFKVE